MYLLLVPHPLFSVCGGGVMCFLSHLLVVYVFTTCPPPALLCVWWWRYQVAKAGIIVGDPSYFSSDKSRVVGKVVRTICILDHPIKGRRASGPADRLGSALCSIVSTYLFYSQTVSLF